MIENGVLISDDPNAEAKAQPKKRGPFENQLIFFRFELLDLRPALRRLYPLLRLLFSPFALAAWLALIALAGATVAANADAALGSMRDALSLSASTAVTLGACFLALKVIHEFGHAAAYRFFCEREALATGPIRAGVCFFALAPFPFTNVTGAWRLRSRWRRAAIGAAGIYFETWAAALALIAWASLAPGELRTAAFQLALISGVSTLAFNLNPLVRLDGYFIFTDLAGAPNLGTRAALSSRSITSWMLGAPWRGVSWSHVAYSVGAYAYRWAIFAGVFWIAYAVDPRLAIPVAIIALSLLVLRPLITSVRTAFAAGATPRGGVALATLGAVAAALTSIPVADWAIADGKVERFEETPVYPSSASRVDFVAGAGAPAVALRLSDLALEVDEAEAQLSLTRADMAIRAAKISHPEVAAQLREEREAIVARLASLDARAADLETVIADGAIWMPIAARRLEGSWVAPNVGALGVIAAPQPTSIKARLPQAELAGLDIKAGEEASIIAWHDPECAFRARIDVMADTATQGFFEIAMSMTDAPDCALALPHGAAVRARLDRAPAAIAVQLWRGALKLAQSRLPIDVKP